MPFALNSFSLTDFTAECSLLLPAASNSFAYSDVSENALKELVAPGYLSSWLFGPPSVANFYAHACDIASAFPS